jgi:hypothetical protein
MQAIKAIRLENAPYGEQMSVRASVALWVGLAILGWLPIVGLVSALS